MQPLHMCTAFCRATLYIIAGTIPDASCATSQGQDHADASDCNETNYVAQITQLDMHWYLPMHGMVKSRDSVTRFVPAAMTRFTTSLLEQLRVLVVVCMFTALVR